jgi:SWI/SNF-related matrix-associated actin-dependent regulator 1 of chromatin subfamily A
MDQINIVREGDTWTLQFKFSYETKDFVKSLGFWFDGDRKVWYTKDPLVAAKLSPDGANNVTKQIEASQATDSDIDIPVPAGLAYFPFQKAGIAYAMQRPNTLIADEMGLGKTIQAIGVINTDPSISTVLVVCPATLKLNWQNELNKWLVRKMSVGIVGNDVPETNIVIINFDILVKWHEVLTSRVWDLLIIDESHKVKNEKAKRTQHLLGDAKNGIAPIEAHRKLFLTGTPIVNRPRELWTLLHAIDPQGMGRNFFGYAKRYCNATKGEYGWDFNGASNLSELQMKLRASFMVRRLKQDVLAELPPKRRQIVVLTPSGAAVKAVAREQEMFDRLYKTDKDQYARVAQELIDNQEIAFTEMSEVRHATAVAKIPYVIDFLNDVLDDNDNKVVVMLHHHDVAHAIADAFPGSAIVTGETPVNKRQAEVERFQNDPACRMFIGSIHAAGVGITLTAASHVVFAELDWVPGNVSQAEDRCHRIGQRDSVLVQHLVFDNSVDSRMAGIIVAKQAVIDSALDEGMKIPKVEVVVGPQPVKEPVVNPGDLPPEQVEAIHTALKLLASRCDGAFAEDGAGFNKLDTNFGHSLASAPRLSQKQAAAGKKLANKYRRQLPGDLMAVILQ